MDVVVKVRARVVLDVDAVVQRVIVTGQDGVVDIERALVGAAGVVAVVGRQRAAARRCRSCRQVTEARPVVVVAGVVDRVEDQVRGVGGAAVEDRVGVGDLVARLGERITRLHNLHVGLEQVHFMRGAARPRHLGGPPRCYRQHQPCSGAGPGRPAAQCR